MTKTTTTYQLLGITDETDTCECCGKTGLKRVVALRINDGAVVRYGTTCAAKALRSAGMNISKSAIDSEAEAVAYCQRWLDAGRDARKVADRAWTKFGFTASVREGSICFQFATVSPSPIELDEYNAEWLAYNH